MARGDALQRVGDEVARAPLRLRLRLLLEHADAARELVPDQLLAALEQMRLRLLQRQAGDALELGLLGDLRLLQLVLELAEMDLAVGEALILPRQLDELPLDLLFLREHALLDLQHRLAAVGELGVDLRAQLDGLLARLDLRLAAERLGFALGVLDQLAPDAPRLADARSRRRPAPRGARARLLRRFRWRLRSRSARARLLGWVAPSGTGPAPQFPRSRCQFPCARTRPLRRSRRYLAVVLRRLGVERVVVMVRLSCDQRVRKSAVCRQNVG